MGERNVAIVLIATVFMVSVILILVSNFHLEPNLDPAAPDEKDQNGSLQESVRKAIRDIEYCVDYGDVTIDIRSTTSCSEESNSLETESPMIGVDVRLPHIG